MKHYVRTFRSVSIERIDEQINLWLNINKRNFQPLSISNTINGEYTKLGLTVIATVLYIDKR